MRKYQAKPYYYKVSVPFRSNCPHTKPNIGYSGYIDYEFGTAGESFDPNWFKTELDDRIQKDACHTIEEIMGIAQEVLRDSGVRGRTSMFIPPQDRHVKVAIMEMRK